MVAFYKFTDMERIVLKWSCNRKKFEDIVLGGLKETLGSVDCTTWELTISSENRRILTSLRSPVKSEYCPYPFWTFEVSRSYFDKELKATAKVISNNKVYSNDVTFQPNQKSAKIFDSLSTEGLVDYRLAFCLSLERNSNTDDILKEEFQVTKLQQLSTCLQTLFENESMSDVVLKCDSLTLKAHKSILSCQSLVFEAMFKSPMLEKEQDTVVIKDIEQSVLRTMISFMYSGQLKVSSESVVYELLYAAEKYQIESLKEGCIEYLRSVLSVENAIRILEVSNMFDRQLKLHCLGFINNNFEELKCSKDWQDLKLKNPVLALEVYTSNEKD